MTKCELIKAIEGYNGDDEVYITLTGAKTIYEIEVITNHYGSPVLESDEAPDFSDLVGMAKAHNEEFGGNIAVYQEAV